MKIIFIYNADSGLVNTWLDIGHKIVSPNTYSCNLCSITHGLFNEKTEWLNYKESNSHNLEFLHKDEFHRKYQPKEGLTFPIVLQYKINNEFDVLITTEEINKIKSIQELIKMLPKS
jgi:hypothetical protein